MRALCLAAGLVIASAAAQAQNLPTYLASPNPGQLPLGGTVPTDQDYLFVSRNVPSATNPTGYETVSGGFLPLRAAFASVQGATGPVGATGPAGPQGIQGIQGPPGETNTAGLIAIANRLDRFANRFREGIALAGSINVLPPNPGDRFAVSLGGAGYDGAGAASIAVSARIREDILAYAAVARGPTQTLVKGGVGFSFR